MVRVPSNFYRFGEIWFAGWIFVKILKIMFFFQSVTSRYKYFWSRRNRYEKNKYFLHILTVVSRFRSRWPPLQVSAAVTRLAVNRGPSRHVLGASERCVTAMLLNIAAWKRIELCSLARRNVKANPSADTIHALRFYYRRYPQFSIQLFLMSGFWTR